jgi:hypothetical protein
MGMICKQEHADGDTVKLMKVIDGWDYDGRRVTTL